MVERAVHYYFAVFDDQLVGDAMDRLRRKSKQLELSNRRLRGEQTRVNRRLRDAKGRFVGAADGVGRLNGRLRDAKGRFVKTSKATKRATKSVVEMEAAVELASKAWRGLTKAADAFKAPVDAAVTYERLYNKLRTLSDDIGAETQQALLELASNVPQTVEDVLTAGYQALSAGVATETLPVFLKASSDLARQADTELTPTVNLLSASLNSYRAQGLSAAEATDVLVQTYRKGVTTIPELSTTLGNVASVASSAGLSFKELGGSIAAMTKVRGGGTAEAITQLRSLINILRNPPARTVPVLKSIGAEFGTAALKAKGLRGVLVGLEQAAEANNVDLGALFRNVEATNGLLALTGPNAAEFAQALDDMEGSAGAAAEGLAKVEGDARDLLDQLGATTDALLVELGQQALPIVKEKLEELVGFIRDNGDVMVEAFSRFVDTLVDVGAWLSEHGDALLVFFGASGLFSIGKVQRFAKAIDTDLMTALGKLGGVGGLGGALSSALKSPTVIGLALGGAYVLGEMIGEAIGDAMTEEYARAAEQIAARTEDLAARMRSMLAGRGFETAEQETAARAQVEAGELIPRQGVRVGSTGGVTFANDLASAEQLVAEDGEGALGHAEEVAASYERAAGIVRERGSEMQTQLERARGEFAELEGTAQRLRGKDTALGFVEQGQLVNAVQDAEALGRQILDIEASLTQLEAEAAKNDATAETIRRSVLEAANSAWNEVDAEGGTRSGIQVAADEKARKKAARRAAAARKRLGEQERRAAEQEAERFARLQLAFDNDLASRRVALIRDEGARRLQELQLRHDGELRSEAAQGERLQLLLELQASERARLLEDIAREEAKTRAQQLAQTLDNLGRRADAGDIGAINERETLLSDNARGDAIGALDDRAASGLLTPDQVGEGKALLRQAEAEQLQAIAETEGHALAGIAGELQGRLTEIAEEGSRRRIQANIAEVTATAAGFGALASSAGDLLDAMGASERAKSAVKAGAMIALGAEETALAIGAGAAGNYLAAGQHALAAAAAGVAAVEHLKVAGGGGGGKKSSRGGSGGSSTVDARRVRQEDRDRGPQQATYNINVGGMPLVADPRPIELAVGRAVQGLGQAPGRPRFQIRRLAV